jgi:hypothetical protein
MSDGGSRILKPHMEELQPILDSRDQKECIEKLNQEIVTGYCLQNEKHVATAIRHEVISGCFI